MVAQAQALPRPVRTAHLLELLRVAVLARRPPLQTVSSLIILMMCHKDHYHGKTNWMSSTDIYDICDTWASANKSMVSAPTC